MYYVNRPLDGGEVRALAWPWRRVLRIVLLAFVLFSVWLAAGRLYVASAIEAPLSEALLAHPAVERVDLQRGRDGLQIIVALAPVTSLRDTHAELQAIISDRLSDNDDALTLLDRRDAQLSEAFARLRPYWLEAAARGNWTAMQRQFAHEARVLGLADASRFDFDHPYIFVQLFAGDRYLYHREPLAGLRSDAHAPVR